MDTRRMLGLQSTVQLGGFASVLCATIAIPIIWYVRNEREKPGVLWFMVGTAAGGLLGTAFGLSLLLTNPAATVVSVRFGQFLVGLSAVCWFLLAIEYTTRRRFSSRAFLLLIAVPLALQFAIWTNPSHHLIFAAESYVDASGVFRFEPGPLWPLIFAYATLLIGLATGMWLTEWFRVEGDRRRQITLMLLATLVLTSAIPIFVSGVLEPFDLSPVTFVLGMGIIGYALVHYQLFQVTPVGRDTTFREMDDAVVILDDEQQVADANPTAQGLLNLDTKYAGKLYDEVLAEFPPLVTALDAPDPDSELDITVDGTDRHFDLQVTPVDIGDSTQGRVVVLRDITPLKQRETELDLLKQVLTRVFRHNIRNDLTAIQGHAEYLQANTEGQLRSSAETILSEGNHLLAQSEKARRIEAVIDSPDATVDLDLVVVMREVLDEVLDPESPATVTTDLPASAPVRVHQSLDVALEELLENARDHTPPGTEIRITATQERRRVELTIADDGPGLPEQEIDVLAAERETALEHGSGVGLWLARLIVERSGGDLSLSNTETGARALLTLERAASSGDSSPER